MEIDSCPEVVCRAVWVCTSAFASPGGKGTYSVFTTSGVWGPEAIENREDFASLAISGTTGTWTAFLHPGSLINRELSQGVGGNVSVVIDAWLVAQWGHPFSFGTLGSDLSLASCRTPWMLEAISLIAPRDI